MSIKRFLKWYYIVPAAVVLAPLFIAWREITLLQGFGLLALCRILFGGFGGGHGGGGGSGRSKKMSPEERERFRQRMRERVCGPSGESPPAAGAAPLSPMKG
jgi:hypothetical protein